MNNRKLQTAPSRVYEPAWLALKERREVILRVAPHLVVRVRKAVIKEKDMDLPFKFLQDEEGSRKLYMRSIYSAETWELKLWLVESKTPSLAEL